MYLYLGFIGCPEDPSVYFIDQHSIKCFGLKDFNNTHVNVKTVKTGFRDTGAIDMDHREHLLFWSDYVQFTINSLNLVTGEIKVISAQLIS